MRQVDTGIKTGGQRDTAPYGVERDAHARWRQRGRRRAEGILRTRQRCPHQAAHAHGHIGRQIVLGLDVQGGDDEIALRRRVGIDLGMASEREPLAGAQVAHIALAVEALGVELVPVHAQLAKSPVVFHVVARVRHLDLVVVQACRKPVAAAALVGHAARGGGHELGAERIAVVPAVPGSAACLQAPRGAPRHDRVAFFRGAARVITHGARAIFRQRTGIAEQHQRVAR